jgi:predicted GIY-YIG superfamily endonuclease
MRLFAAECPSAYQPGPTPGEREYTVSAKDHEDWYVYVLLLSNNKAAKVGFSHEPKSRLKEYNHAILPEITGVFWRLAFTHRVPNAETAKRIEQHILAEHAVSQLQSNGEVLQNVDITELQLGIIGFAEALKLN